MGGFRRMGNSSEKRPTHEETPPSDLKTPRRLANPGPSGECPRWSFCVVDSDGPWCFSAMKGKRLGKVLKRLGAFEGMTFEQLRAAKCHDLATESVSSKAMRRLEKIKLDDAADSLYSLRIDSTRRIIGIRHLGVVHILWWDPDHEVSPSEK